MKTLILVRHAKSDWSNPFLDDFDRPLNDRGKSDAPLMAGRLKNKNIFPQQILSSPSIRTLSTAEYFVSEFNDHNVEMITDMDLYHVSPDIIVEVIQKYAGNNNCIMLLTHNPAITEFVNEYSTLRTDNVPTCGVVILSISEWKKLGEEKAALIDFDYPKKHTNS
jgi:phosphohistidine phosphatase